MFPPPEEATDEFDKYYSQFRPRACQSYSPASTSYYSSFSSQNNSGSDKTDQYSFTRHYPSPFSPFQPTRSRSRDWGGPSGLSLRRPRTAEPESCQETDNVSRDSGHSSGSSTSPTSPSLARSDWTYRRTPSCHPDNFSVRSLDMSRQRPVVLPRRSLQANIRREDNPGEETANNPDAPRLSLAYTVIATSLVIGSLAILVSAYSKHSCHLANSVVWDLQQLKQQLRTKVIGQTQSLGRIEGKI